MFYKRNQISSLVFFFFFFFFFFFDKFIIVVVVFNYGFFFPSFSFKFNFYEQVVSEFALPLESNTIHHHRNSRRRNSIYKSKKNSLSQLLAVYLLMRISQFVVGFWWILVRYFYKSIHIMLSSFYIYSLLGLCYFKHYQVLTFILGNWIGAFSCTKCLGV